MAKVRRSASPVDLTFMEDDCDDASCGGGMERDEYGGVHDEELGHMCLEIDECGCPIPFDERARRVDARIARANEMLFSETKEERLERRALEADAIMRASAPKDDWVDVDPKTVPDEYKDKDGVPLCNKLRRPLLGGEIAAAKIGAYVKHLEDEKLDVLWDNRGRRFCTLPKGADPRKYITERDEGRFDMANLRKHVNSSVDTPPEWLRQ